MNSGLTYEMTDVVTYTLYCQNSKCRSVSNGVTNRSVEIWHYFCCFFDFRIFFFFFFWNLFFVYGKQYKIKTKPKYNKQKTNKGKLFF